jgi:hypothetical protein
VNTDPAVACPFVCVDVAAAFAELSGRPSGYDSHSAPYVHNHLVDADGGLRTVSQRLGISLAVGDRSCCSVEMRKGGGEYGVEHLPRAFPPGVDKPIIQFRQDIGVIHLRLLAQSSSNPCRPNGLRATEDPLFPIGHAVALTREIPGAHLLTLDGGDMS